jgi:hypothetical protein
MANSFKNYGTAAIGTATTVVYTANTGVQATIIGMTVANLLNTSITANVVVNISNSSFFMVKNAQIDSGSSLIPVGGGQKLVLEAGDSITVNTNTASSVDVIVSLLEIT